MNKVITILIMLVVGLNGYGQTSIIKLTYSGEMHYGEDVDFDIQFLEWDSSIIVVVTNGTRDCILLDTSTIYVSSGDKISDLSRLSFDNWEIPDGHGVPRDYWIPYKKIQPNGQYIYVTKSSNPRIKEINSVVALSKNMMVDFRFHVIDYSAKDMEVKEFFNRETNAILFPRHIKYHSTGDK